MAVRKIRNKWYVDFRFQHPDGRVERVRKCSPISSKAGCEEYERLLRTQMLAPAVSVQPKEVPRFAAFAALFMKTYAAANNKPSERAAKESILKHHLLPAFGDSRCDEIRTLAIEAFKAAKLAAGLGCKRVNNLLACLSKILNYAKETEVIATAPKIKFLKLPPPKFDFLTFEELERLLYAVQDDASRRAMFLLGAEAGLRQGEIIALEWDDVDFVAGVLTVRKSSWRGIIGSPKSGSDRKIPMTERLSMALKKVRHLRGSWVFCSDDGKPQLTPSAFESALRYACRRAGLRRIFSHVLRHTFCSHLAMRGAAPKAIQELAGHATVSMTMRYMHLAPVTLHETIKLLNSGQPVGNAAPSRF
jgi:integrase